MGLPSILWLFLIVNVVASYGSKSSSDRFQDAVDVLEQFASQLGPDGLVRHKRQEVDPNGGVTNLDIRDAILQMLNLIRESRKLQAQHDKSDAESSTQILNKLNSMGGAESVEKKIDNISTFLLRMNAKLDEMNRKLGRGVGGASRGGGASGSSGDALTTLAQESFDILVLLPTYIENIKDSIASLSNETQEKFQHMEYLLVDGPDDSSASNENGKQSIAKVLRVTEANLLNASTELKEIVIESGHMAESLFERVNDGYRDLTAEIKGLSNVEKVLLATADSVIDTKRKIEFGVQQIIKKVGEVVKMSGGELDENLKDKFADITRTILSNQTEALRNLTQKVEKEIGQVWRQMGIMYTQVSSSISILEKMKVFTEGYVNKTGSNLGAMEGQVSGLTDRMVDVDQSLNYMLGQLSLVVQEFNQVKTGLGEAMSGLGEELDQIKEYKTKAQPEEED